MNKTALFIQHQARTGHRADMQRVWEKYVKPQVEANPAHEAYFFCHDEKDPDVVRVFQLYSDAAAARNFMSGDWYAQYLSEVSKVVTAPPQIVPATLVWAKGFMGQRPLNGAVIEEVDAGSDDAQRLIRELDQDLNVRYPGEPTNGIDAKEFREGNGYFVVVRDSKSGVAVACGAFRPVSEHCVEMKRMFVQETFRGRGFARAILQHLEVIAEARGFRGFVLETGTGNPEAIKLYESSGYFRIPKYGHYVSSPKSVCFAKQA